MWRMNWGALLTLLPTVVAAGWTALDMSLHRRAVRHADLLGKVPEGVDAEALRTLLALELGRIAAGDRRKLHRRLAVNTLLGLAVFVIMLGAVGWFLWATQTWWGWPAWLIQPILVIIGGIGAALVLAGVSQLWEYPEDEKGAGSGRRTPSART